MPAAEPSLDALREAVRRACYPTYVPEIMAGRQQVLAMPRQWVIERLEEVAVHALDLSDYWEYRRLLELAELLDSGLVRRLVAIGEHSNDADVREAADDFRSKSA